MPKIIQLDAHLANLIAAGEVVERPASVVKELVENSIDAGARSITVELQNGGVTFLRIRDDGCGMSREDAKTAFLRHATSKLRTKEDLEAIGTLGFRGEALAATAAVSRVDLLTRTAEDLEGTHLTLEGGKLLSCQAAGCPVGTTIVVRDLFFNTPARMKFLKRDSVEGSAAAGALQKQALAHPEIAFHLIKDGQTQLRTPGDGELLSAVYAVLGRQAAMEMIPVSSRWEKLGVTGFVSKPTATRGTRANQIFFVNHRYIRSKTLTAALEEAYRNQLMVGRFPSCVLNIEMPLASVDVNVHPAKTEVKFLNEREIFDCVHYGVLGALNKAPGQVPFAFGEGSGIRDRGSGTRDQGSEPAFQSLPLEGTGGVPWQKVSPQATDEVGSRPAGSSDNRFFKAMTAEEYRKVAKPQVHTVTRWEYQQMTKTLGKTQLPEPSQALREAVRPAALNSPVALPLMEEDVNLAGGGTGPSTPLRREASPLGRSAQDDVTGAGRGDSTPDAPAGAGIPAAPVGGGVPRSEASPLGDAPRPPISDAPELPASAAVAPAGAGTPDAPAGADVPAAPVGGGVPRSEASPLGDAPKPPISDSPTPPTPDVPEPLPGVQEAPDFRYIGEAFRTYILVEQGEELILIDKHAAHERINFERLLAQGTQILGQTLLEPRACRLDREEAAILLEHRELLLSLGYDLDDLGQGDLLLRQIPSDIRDSDAEATLSEIADHLRDGRLDTPQRLRDEALHTIACKAAIKAGYVTDPRELRQLAATVLSNPDLKYCPHGRPICTFITKRQVEKQFKRIT